MFNLDSHMIPFAIAMTLMTVLFIFGMVAFLIIIKNRQNKKSRAYMQSLVDEKERTMCKISLEVHDNVVQMLILSRQILSMVEDGSHSNKEEGMAMVINMLNTLVMDTQNIGHALNPDYLKRKGLLASLQEEARWVNASKKVDCYINIEGEYRRLDAQAELMAFRIAQEAIQNTIKHAEATQILIQLFYENEEFQLSVTDDGIGFDKHGEDMNEGVGLLGMRQRAKIVNGEVNVYSAQDMGTTVSLKIPNL